MPIAVRSLSIGWFIAGLTLATSGTLELLDNPIQKHGRLWELPLLPTILLLTAWAALALGRGLWLGSSYVGILGRVMSLPLFAISMFPLVGAIALLSSLEFSVDALLYFAGGVLGMALTIFNYRAAQFAQPPAFIEPPP